MLPGSTLAIRTSIDFVVAGNVADVDTEAFISSLAAQLGVHSSQMRIRLVAASVRIEVVILTFPGPSAASVQQSLTDLVNAGTASMSSVLGLTVESATQPTAAPAVLPAPSPPPPQPCLPTDPPHGADQMR